MIVNKQKGRKKNIFFNNQKGMALITTLIFIFVLVSFSVALLVMTSNESKLSTLHRESTRAFYLAETGVDKALWYLNTPTDQGGKGLSWRTTDETGPLTDPSGTASEYYEVTVVTVSAGDPEIIVIKSTGKVLDGEYSKGTRIVEVKLEKGVTPSLGTFYNHAILTFSENSDLRLHGHPKIIGSIHSNGTITGSGFNPDEDIEGEITSSGENNLGGDMVDVILEEFLPAVDWDALLLQAESEQHEGITGSIVYPPGTAIEFNDDVLSGIHYIKGDLIIKNSLQVKGVIIVEGDIKVQGNPDIILDQVKTGLVMAAKGNITLGGNAHINGVIHSLGYVTVNGTINIDKGAIFARDGVINGTGADLKVVYDPNLAGEPVSGTGIPVWKIASWQEVY